MTAQSTKLTDLGEFDSRLNFVPRSSRIAARWMSHDKLRQGESHDLIAVTRGAAGNTTTSAAVVVWMAN